MSSKTTSKKSIGFILTYNSAETLEDAYRRIPAGSLDIIFVSDDGSIDNTSEVAKKIGVPFFTHEHRGYGGNVKCALIKALEMGGEYMVEIHGDGQFDPFVIPLALKKMEGGRCDLLFGSRFTNLLQPLKDGMSLLRYMANVGLSFFDRLILGVPFTEFHAGFRVYSRKLLSTVPFLAGAEDYLFSFQIIAQARYFNMNFGEIPIRCNYRKKHTSISLFKSAIYSFQTFCVLALYICARIGIKSRIFQDTLSTHPANYEE